MDAQLGEEVKLLVPLLNTALLPPNRLSFFGKTFFGNLRKDFECTFFRVYIFPSVHFSVYNFPSCSRCTIFRLYNFPEYNFPCTTFRVYNFHPILVNTHNCWPTFPGMSSWKGSIFVGELFLCSQVSRHRFRNVLDVLFYLPLISSQKLKSNLPMKRHCFHSKISNSGLKFQKSSAHYLLLNFNPQNCKICLFIAFLGQFILKIGQFLPYKIKYF